MHEMTASNPESKRLFQWIQQQAGIARRKAQELIAGGEVSVNGAPVTDPFFLVDLGEIARLTLRGQPLPLDAPEARIYRYYKPRGVLCSHEDRFSGNTVGRILRTEGFVGYTWVGRLDQDAEGLLLLTNDGGLVHAFTHPRYAVHKSYRIELARTPNQPKAERIFAEMRRGIDDEGDTLRIVSATFEPRSAGVHVTLAEGKKREIKRLFSHFGLEVVRLVRVSVGPIELGTLRPGEIERLDHSSSERVLGYAHGLLAARPQAEIET